MSVLEIKPLVMKDVELIIGGTAEVPGTDDYRKHVDSVMFTPTSSQITWTGLGLNTHSDQSIATWALALGYAQDWESANSLSRFLHENEGKTFPCEFRPMSGAGPSFKSEITVTPGAIGGPVNAYGTATVNLGTTRPELVAAA